MVGRVLLAVMVPVALGKGCQLAPVDTSEEAPRLVVEAEAVEWEDAPLDQSVEQTLTIENQGNLVLSLSFALEGDESFEIVSSEEEVDAGGSQDLSLGFTAPGYLARSGTLVITSDAPSLPRLEVPLRGIADPDQDDDGQDAVAAGGMDCDDTDPDVYDYAPEYCNDQDDDCDGLIDDSAVDATKWYRDVDGDGHGDPERSTDACSQPDGYVSSADDCDDLSDTTWPGADETCNLVDDDCDEEVDEDAIDAPTWYTDADGDGHGDPSTGVQCCQRPGTAVRVGDDCDDTDPDVTDC